MNKTIRWMLVAALAIVPALAAAQSDPAGKDHGPSPQAVAACQDKSEGDACEFDAPHGHVSGTCRKVRTGEVACVPHHHHDAGAHDTSTLQPAFPW